MLKNKEIEHKVLLKRRTRDYKMNMVVGMNVLNICLLRMLIYEEECVASNISQECPYQGLSCSVYTTFKNCK